MMPEPTSKEYKNKQKALRGRSGIEPSEDRYADFEIVHELVSAAYATYEERGNLKKCLKDLGNDILSASKK